MGINLALRFLLEVAALIAVGYWGFQTGKGPFFKFLLGLGAPIMIAVVWGMYGSPAAPYPVQGILRLLLEFLIFGLAALTLYFAGHPTLAVLFGVLVIINRILMHVWNQ